MVSVDLKAAGTKYTPYNLDSILNETTPLLHHTTSDSDSHYRLSLKKKSAYVPTNVIEASDLPFQTSNVMCIQNE
ncbi:hypothetical protein N7476_008343 [Penicillium atrosanguineum]|uniref:Uncharacterized protein n=1 Tax=Penicillium atrosanguineum TaxID=1132637 RepID=A0A9W9U1L2_9EURO|nr:hypothetical protein N7476_008343 [Penicillium atrosanguineum]